MRRTPPLSSTAARIRPPVFGELQARIDRLGARGVELVPLQIGDTWLAPPELAPPQRPRRILAELDGNAASLYRYGPPAAAPACRELVAKLVRRHGLDVDP